MIRNRRDQSQWRKWAVLAVFAVSVGGCDRDSPPPTPKGRADVVVDGVTLEPPPSNFGKYCRLAASRLARQVPCPALIPGPSIAPARGAELCSGNDGKLGSRPCLSHDVYLLQRIFGAEDSYKGLGPGRGAGHLSIWSVPTSSLRQQGFGCAWFGRTDGSVAVGELEGTFFSCPEVHDVSERERFPIDSGHLVLQFAEGGYSVGVSLHGHSNANRRIAVMIAKSLSSIAP